MQIKIDNFFVDPDQFATDATQIQIDVKDASRRSFSGGVQFYGSARDYVLDRLALGTGNRRTDYINIRIYLDGGCCAAADGSLFEIFAGRANRGDISWGENYGLSDCSVTVTPVAADADADALQCLRNVVVYDTKSPISAGRSIGENEDRIAPKFGYYEETRPYSMAMFMNIVILFILTLYAPLGIVLTIVTGGLLDLSFAYQGLVDVLAKKRYHKAPFIRSYLVNSCKLCGLQLRSSLFDPSGFLYNLCRLDAPFVEGESAVPLTGRGNSATQIFDDFNAPNISAVQLLETFRQLNIGYTVRGGQLLVEKQSDLIGTIWIDFITRQIDILSLEYEPSGEPDPSGEIFAYAEDQSDKVGNEAGRVWSGKTVDYNIPYNPTLRGIRQTILPYGATRFVGDTPYIGERSATAWLANSSYFQIITFGTSPIDNRAIITMSGVFSQPKLLFYSPLNTDGTGGANVEATNGVLNGRAWLRNDMQGAPWRQGNLYSEFLTENDPRLNAQKKQDFTLRFSATCDDIRTMRTARSIQLDYMGTGAVVGEIDAIDLDLSSNEITITGKI